MLDYLKTVITTNKQNGLLLRFSSHLALFYRSASFQIKVTFFFHFNQFVIIYLIINKTDRRLLFIIYIVALLSIIS